MLVARIDSPSYVCLADKIPEDRKNLLRHRQHRPQDDANMALEVPHIVVTNSQVLQGVAVWCSSVALVSDCVIYNSLTASVVNMCT